MSADVRVVGGNMTVDISSFGMNANAITTQPLINRECFAMAAMQALLTHPLEALQVEYATYQLECPVGKEPLEMVDWLADRAFQVAEAMQKRSYK